MRRGDVGYGAWIGWDVHWLDQDEADEAFAELRDNTPWEQLPIQAGHKEVLQPRLMAWAGETPYRYSGLTLESRPLTGRLADLAARASEAAGVPFDHVVLNLYRDGRDHIRMHADDERELGRDPTIGSLSLGATRRFVFQAKRKRRAKRTMRLSHGSLLVMGGAFQHTWYHGIPADPEAEGTRINVTFRRLMGPPGWRPEPREDAPR